MFLRLVYLAFVALTASESFDLDAQNSEFRGIRLPNDTKPISYDIHLTTNIHLSESEYSGVVSVTLKVVQDTNEIVMHAGEDIKINKVSLIDQEKGSELGKNVNYTRDSRNDFFTIFSEVEPLQLEQGKEYLLTVSFNGSHDQFERGFYISALRTVDLKVEQIASTFFEPIYARLAFPCYDEPMFKARISLAITHGANLTALSNMPVDGDPIATDDGMVTTKFKRTPPMSVYALAFVVGSYNSISVEINNITHRVFSTSTDRYKGEFSLDIASKSLHAFEDYFGVNYPLPKMDHISVSMFPAAAMENWGLVIHNSKHLLTYSNTSKLNNLQTSIIVVHETAHQWFGNLVTPKWWNYAWLSEGISTFYTNKILEILHPEWKPTEYALFVGCGSYWHETESQPMTQYVENEPNIWYKFEKLFYCKGDKIMRMFELALTSATMKKGIILYLNKYQYSNVEESDLFECLQTAATGDKILGFEEPGTVHKAMSSWTQQKNYPRISVERDYVSGTFKLIQSPAITRFNVDVNNPVPSEEQLWWIPVTFATASDPNFNNTTTDFIFNEKNLTVDASTLNKTLLEDDWLLLNKQQIGMYQVMYDETNWNLIIDALKKNPNAIPNYNKMQLIRDAGYLHAKSLLSSKIIYNLLSYLENEEDILPWLEAFKVMDYILVRLWIAKGAEYFQFFARSMARKVSEKISTYSEDNDTAIMEEFRNQYSYFVYNMNDT